MGRFIIGCVAAAAAMFVIGFIFLATPLHMLGFSSVNDAASASIQNSLAANLPATGTYMVPSTNSAAGTILYGRGPVATVHYNMGGFAVADPRAMLAGFVHMLVSVTVLGLGLLLVAGRVTDFPSRARLVLYVSLASGIFMHLGEPIWFHHDWRNAVYLFMADFIMLAAGGLIIARWFLSGIRLKPGDTIH